MEKLYGILAHPAGHSLSPAMHNALFRELGVAARYDFFDVLPENLQEFWEQRVRSGEISGLSVSLPFKETVLGLVDEVSQAVKEIGALNTVWWDEGKLAGTNTDWIGSNTALLEVCPNLSGKKAVVIGAGGSARAVIYGLKKLGAKVLICNRSPEKAEELAKEFGCEWGGLEDLVGSGAEVLINTTAIWTIDGGAQVEDLVAESFWQDQKLEVVMDIAYKPLITPLLARAEQAGVKTIDGKKMLLYQGVEQAKIWNKLTELPTDVMAKALYQ